MSKPNLQTLNLESKTTVLFVEDLVAPTKSNKAADIDCLINQINAISLSKGCLTDYENILKGNVVFIASSQAGSVFLQNLLELSNNEVVNMLYAEMKSCLYSLMKQTYANYFCQLLFKKLDDQCKYEVVMEIIGNLSQMLKNMISFKASVSILETPLKESTQDEILKVLSTVCKSTLISHARYLKVLEVLITHLNEDKISVILDIIKPVFSSLLKIKQGYFLLRKIVKKVQSIELKHKIINFIEMAEIAETLSNNNGCLLIQCIVKSFEVINDSGSDCIEELISINSITKLFQNSMDKGSTSTSGKSIGRETEAMNIKDSVAQEAPVFSSISTTLDTCGHDIEDNPIVRLFDLITMEVVFKFSTLKYTKPIYKSLRKIYNLFLSLSKHSLKERMIYLMYKKGSIGTMPTIFRNILIFTQNSMVLEQLLGASIKAGSFDELIICVNQTQISDLPQFMKSKWLSFKSQLHNKARCDLKAFDSKLIVGFELQNQSSSVSDDSVNMDEDNFLEFIEHNQSFFDHHQRKDIPKDNNIALKNMNILDQIMLEQPKYQPTSYQSYNSNFIANNRLPYQHFYPNTSIKVDQPFAFFGLYNNVVPGFSSRKILNSYPIFPPNANNTMRGSSNVPYSNIYQNQMPQVHANYSFAYRFSINH